MTTSMARLSTAWIPIALALAAGQARAQSVSPLTPSSPTEDALQRAHTHFEAGRALYKLGNFSEAAREFASGYELAPRPGFLLNLGQCYIAMHDLHKAREMYQRWLHDAPDNDPERRQAEDILREIERKLAAPPSEPAATAAGPEGTRSGETPPPLIAPAPTTLHAGAPPRPWIKRNWWLIPVSLVVVGAAVGVGVYFGTRNDPCSGPNVIACFPVTGKGML
jgi:tetratricopeptide (TPR) repeat protein